MTRRRDYRLLVSASARALMLHISFCRFRRLKCLDPPLLAASLLPRLGLRGYEARRLWDEARAAAEEAREEGLVLYRWGSTLWRLEPVFTRGEVFYDPVSRLPLDPDDCRLLGDCTRAPRANMFKVYVSGLHGDEVVRINIVYIAVLVEEATKGLASEALEAFEKMIMGGSVEEGAIKEFIEAVLQRGRRLLSLFLPRAPGGLEELLHYSPASRLLFNLLSGQRASQ